MALTLNGTSGIVGAGIGTIGPSGANITGVVTATSFVGNVTGTASANAVLTGSTNNTVATVTGANAITGEANLTFDGEQLNVKHAGTATPENQIVLNGSAIEDGGGSGVFFKSSTNTTANRYGSRIHTTRESGGASNLIFSTEITGGGTGLQEALKISPNKNVTVSDGDLVIGTSGHGIDFSATSDGTTMTSELLDDYEEGSFTPNWDAPDQSGSTFVHSHAYGYYTKIGNVVTVTCYVQGYCNGNSGGGSNDNLKIVGLPFAPATIPGGGSSNRHAANFAIGSRYKLEVDDLTAYAYGGNTYIDLIVPSNGGTGTPIKTNQADQNTCQFQGTATYRVP